ncbi:MAG: glucoamylase family protein [Candidatus Obscuribacter sp.]|nr:glucoamylase family protein [Candidatus Obscuribacter sp.]
MRAELFSADQMEEYGKALALAHELAPGQIPDRLLFRLSENDGFIQGVCALLTAAAAAGRRITPAGEWLLDNFYLIEEQIRTARKHLPKGYSKELPRLANGASRGFPRVYDLALETISHGDGRVESENLGRFVTAYQTVSELKLGELWAIPIMLRLALIENLRRVSVRLATHMMERDLADGWADKMLEAAVSDPKNLILVIADMVRSNPPMTSSFVAELTRRLQGQTAALALGLTWIEQRLNESSLTIEQLVQSETQLQATDQVSISNSIGSLRLLGAMDWRSFVENQSVVERTLARDPCGYLQMDFATRDQYRHAVERVARRSLFSEGRVAHAAVELASKQSLLLGAEHRLSHVGYYLIGNGRRELFVALQIAPSLADRLVFHGWQPLFLYLLPLFFLSVSLSVWLVLPVVEGPAFALSGRPPEWFSVLLFLIFLAGVSQFAVILVNWLVTLFLPARPLPKMDFSKGLPPQAPTMVVVPTMLSNEEGLEHLLEGLEVRFLANRDLNLHFALLTDFLDADRAVLESDERLLTLARQGIAQLNEKYGADREVADSTFYLLARPRIWNSKEGVFMGYERKRGKLSALNQLILHGVREPFLHIEGDFDVLRRIKYVITLDTDTELPRDAARQCVGAMEHPLNQPVLETAKDGTVMVRQGFGILQPRVAVSLPGTNRSAYAAMHGNEPGIDPYTRTVSDVYQDLFQEGSFIGKGIYQVAAFEAVLAGRFPDNSILSHDLFEGCYLRSGLVSDVQLYEEYPSSYLADMTRRYRWIRGDWQLLPWLMPLVPMAGSLTWNRLSALSIWKLFDNLRRSLVAPALLLWFCLTWVFLSPAWFWTVAAVSVMFVPVLLISFAALFRKPEGLLVRQHVFANCKATLRQLEGVVLTLACIPFEAMLTVDAVLRTLYRLLVSQRNLLSWNASGQVRGDSSTLAVTYFRMAAAPVFAIAAYVVLLVLRPQALGAAVGVLVAWSLAPALVFYLSRPKKERVLNLKNAQVLFLRRLARRTWAFFDRYVAEPDHWLPPDNVQESPTAVIAHRTSPTNIGMALLANLSAYDFGYIQTGELLERCRSTLETMARLERYRGHFFNWYDTSSLQPLPPRYVSTVDSGNLAGHLLTLNAGLLACPSQPLISKSTFDGLGDTLAVLLEYLEPSERGLLSPLEILLEEGRKAYNANLTVLHDVLGRLVESSAALNLMHADSVQGDAAYYMAAFERQCRSLLAELLHLVPFIDMVRAQSISEAALYDLLNASTPARFSLNDLLAFYEHWQPGADSQVEAALFATGQSRARERLLLVQQLAGQGAAFAAEMEYEFLYDKGRCLLSIGFNADEPRLDASFYDLLASEARLCNFVAIAQGQLPQESWFTLGRLLTSASGEPVLFSWSGSMFEYLMPLLVMPSYENTLLDQTCRTAVARQIEYGKQRGVPWGISESGYFAFDVHLNYQYRAFGVPGLGLKRGLSQDLVIAPYASALALMVEPEAACLNLQALAAVNASEANSGSVGAPADGSNSDPAAAEDGQPGGVERFWGRFGFYEAIDYTASRLPRNKPQAVVRSYMAHHQGMSLLSLLYVLADKPMQKRFQADPSFQATLLLLQERVPKTSVFHLQSLETVESRGSAGGDESPVRFFNSPHTAVPEVQLLSNGRYHVMVTGSGGGYSRHRDLCVTRWREDGTLDNFGSFCYIRDLDSGRFWSNTFQPSAAAPESYEAIFSEARVEFRRRDQGIDTHTEIVVSSEDDIELRRLRITNRSRSRRSLDLTSYAEVVLATSAQDGLHTTFSNLFVETEIFEAGQALICKRRPRSVGEPVPWMFHLMALHGGSRGMASYETDRARFIGRGQSLQRPQALDAACVRLSGSQGAVLDPMVAVRCPITIEPEESITVNIVTGVGESREACLALIHKYQDRALADRVFDLAWTHSQVALRQLNATEADGQLYARLANSIIFSNASLRAEKRVLLKNRRGQSGLWGYAISGDLPIVLLQIEDVRNMELVRQLVQAHAYWRLKGLSVDLVIWNEDKAGYRQAIQEQIMGLIAAGAEANLMDRPGGIFVRPTEQMSADDRILMQTVARVIIKDSLGSLSEQVSRRSVKEMPVPALVPLRARRSDAIEYDMRRSDLILFNELGGFTSDGREYVITTSGEATTPAPWANVLANPEFGTVISESGAGYTWYENAHEFRLTPWNNDPVTDSCGEAFYVRDEETGYFWSPTPLPARGATPYRTRHGFGYSVFEHDEGGITTELKIFVALDAPVKIAVLRVHNHSGRSRRLSATAYVEWVLGDLKAKCAMHVATEIDAKSGAIFASNRYSGEYSNHVAFLDVDDANRTITGDRREFIGRNGSLASPKALERQRLSGRVGAALDPCAAMQVPFELADGQERELVFKLGLGRDAAEACDLVQRFRSAGNRRESFERLCQYWKHTLGAVHIRTPDPALNVLVNGWLLYQTISCRLFARSGYYQSGGAFGFRDQLQDAMALVHTEAHLLRKQLLLCASRQFVEGDVQHWWHPPSGRGVRTRCSDDYLWLPLAVCRYVKMTADTGVLKEEVSFLTGRPVNPQDDSYYDLPGRSGESATLFEHCKRAIKLGMRFGSHGLPLMGCGDWNDGMNLVGEKGLGESVWLAFFLHQVLENFAEVAEQFGDRAFHDLCLEEAGSLKDSIENGAWDGQWYRRAYFDDGTALGTATAAECQIDSISQSWAVLSGAASAERARRAMESVYLRLVRKDIKLIQLLDPPFDVSELNPGYIKGYVPGVRENGGQYTHGAIWAAMAFAKLGDGKRAWELMNMISPVNHALDLPSAQVYKVEPYVISADVYSVAPHTGRGGWSWYTGSAGWMYRLVVESLLGINFQAGQLRVNPCMPEQWSQFEVHYRYRETVYHISIMKDEGRGPSIHVDGVEQMQPYIQLEDDGREHVAEVRIA